jgi:aryl-alcohol dehydrogenase-like predicted oxidoreductase
VIPTRKLGRTNLEVPVICLGGNVYDWTVDEAETFRQLDRAVELGLNFVDTADAYSRWVPGHKGGESETLIGKWFARSRKRTRIVLATKIGMMAGADGKNLSARSIAEGAEASLKRLQTDYLDIYFSHKDDEATPLE